VAVLFPVPPLSHSVIGEIGVSEEGSNFPLTFADNSGWMTGKLEVIQARSRLVRSVVLVNAARSDLREARFWITSGLLTIRPECAGQNGHCYVWA